MPKPKLKAMQSLLERGRSFLTPTPSSANIHGSKTGAFAKAHNEKALFPSPNPAIDGEDCLRDCSDCTVHYPAKFSIDEDDKLYGHVNGWDTHLIVGTGKTDWVRDVTDEKGSVMQAVGKYGQEFDMSNGRGKGKLMLSASNMPSGSSDGDDDIDNGSDCLLLPAWTFIEKVQPAQVPDLMSNLIAKSVSNRTPLSHSTSTLTKSADHTPNGASTPIELPSNHTEPGFATLTTTPSLKTTQFTTCPIPHRALILMCSHKTRDARCGQSAPLLRKEFERILRPMGLHRDLHDNRPGGVGIYFINHVGGHKYSANIMVYRRAGSKRDGAKAGAANGAEEDEKTLEGEAVQGIWLARVRPEDCANIVKYTVLQGKVVKPGTQLRGGFDRERGLASW